MNTVDFLTLAKFVTCIKRKKIVVYHPLDLLRVISFGNIENAACLAEQRNWASILIIKSTVISDVLEIKELDGNVIKDYGHLILKSICKEAIAYEREGYITLIDIYNRLLISKDGTHWELTKVTINPGV